LPRYSPDLNPIEQAFAILKRQRQFSGAKWETLSYPILKWNDYTCKTGGRYETDTHRSAPKVQKKWWISVTFVSHRCQCCTCVPPVLPVLRF
jgi:hypothetical protein